MLEVELPAWTRFVGTVGGWVSGHAAVEASSVARGETLPAASYASTPSV